MAQSGQLVFFSNRRPSHEVLQALLSWIGTRQSFRSFLIKGDGQMEADEGLKDARELEAMLDGQTRKVWLGITERSKSLSSGLKSNIAVPIRGTFCPDEAYLIIGRH